MSKRVQQKQDRKAKIEAMRARQRGQANSIMLIASGKAALVLCSGRATSMIEQNPMSSGRRRSFFSAGRIRGSAFPFPE